MKKILCFLCLFIFFTKNVFGCPCDVQMEMFHSGPWNLFASEFAKTQGLLTPMEEANPLSDLNLSTMNSHKIIEMVGLKNIYTALVQGSKSGAMLSANADVTATRSKTQEDYERDHQNRMTSMKMQEVMQNTRERTLLQDTGILSAGDECVDQQDVHAMYASGGRTNLLRIKQKGRESMRHEPGQARDVIRDRKASAEGYTAAMKEADISTPSVTPQSGMYVFPTNELYVQTRNIVRKLVELDKPYENVDDLGLNDYHKNEYIALRDTRKMISDLRADSVESLIDWYAPIYDQNVIKAMISNFGSSDNLVKYVNQENMASMYSEHKCFLTYNFQRLWQNI